MQTGSSIVAMPRKGYTGCMRRKTAVALAVSSLVGAGCALGILAFAGLNAPSVADRVRADAIVRAMPRAQRAGQVIMTGIGATGYGTAAPSVASILADLRPGAVLLFGYNIPERADLLRGPSGFTGLTSTLASLDARPGAVAPLIAVDHEGGSVFRFKEGVTRLPSASEMGSWPSARIRSLAAKSGAELRALGITLVLAPVVEVLDAENADFLGSRAFGADPAAVAASASAFVRGMRSAGVASTAKHFPGNGSVDPHRGLPVLSTDARAYRASVAPPFAAAIRAGAAAVMLSHAVAPALDPDTNRKSLPTTLSSPLIRGKLKRGLGFSGIVLTDDLYMAALGESGAGTPESAAIAALSAGADMIMLSAPGRALAVRDAIVDALERGRLREARLSDAAARIIAQKIAFGLVDPARGICARLP